MAEREKPPIKKTVTGFDYGIAGVIYYRGEDEFSTPVLMVSNKEWSNGIHLEDNPRFIISLESDVVDDRRIDEKRTLELNSNGEVIGVTFQNSKDGIMLDDLPISEELISEARDLLKAYHEDENPEIEDYWRQKGHSVLI